MIFQLLYPLSQRTALRYRSSGTCCKQTDDATILNPFTSRFSIRIQCRTQFIHRRISFFCIYRHPPHNHLFFIALQTNILKTPKRYNLVTNQSLHRLIRSYTSKHKIHCCTSPINIGISTLVRFLYILFLCRITSLKKDCHGLIILCFRKSGCAKINQHTFVVRC